MRHHVCVLCNHACLQAMRKLKEKTCSVRVRQVDLMLAKEVMEPARKLYTAQFQEDAPVLVLDQVNFLAPPPAGTEDISSW